MSDTPAPFNITREDVINLAAEKLLGQYDFDVEEMISSRVAVAVKAQLDSQLTPTINAALQQAVVGILENKITPRDIWGDVAGKETTIKDQLTKRALEFWDTKVDAKGIENSYSGTPRYEHVVQTVIAEEFNKAIKTNAEVVVKAFRDAMIANGQQLVSDHIKRLVKV